MIEAGVQQIGNRLIPNLVSTLWRIELTPGTAAVADAVRGNVELYRLLGGVRDRQNRLVRVLTRVAVSELGLPPCSAAATSPAPAPTLLAARPSFQGVFRRLIESQDFVTGPPKPSPKNAAIKSGPDRLGCPRPDRGGVRGTGGVCVLAEVVVEGGTDKTTMLFKSGNSLDGTEGRARPWRVTLKPLRNSRCVFRYVSSTSNLPAPSPKASSITPIRSRIER